MDDIDDIADAYSDYKMARILRMPMELFCAPGEVLSEENRLKKENWDRADAIHDHAYFCLIYAQLECFAKQCAGKLCELKKSKSRGSDKAAWEIIGIDGKIPIKKRIKLLLPNDSHVHSQFAKLSDDRNSIVHDAKLDIPLEIFETIKNAKAIADKIRSALTTLEAVP